MYRLLFSLTTKKQLQKIDKPDRSRILSSLERVCTNPDHYISALSQDPSYKIRVGNYRMLIDLDRSSLIVLVVKIAHRKRVYDRL